MKLKQIFIILMQNITVKIQSLFKIFFVGNLNAFGSEINYTKELTMMSDSFFLVVGMLYTGIAFAMIGAISIADITAKKRVSFLFFIITGFTALPDLITAIKSEPTAPLPVILMNLIVIGLFFYGSKKATE